MNESLTEDVCAASAAYCLNCVLPRLNALTPSEQFERLKACFEAALAAYRDGVRGWVYEPSDN
ncbi:hypothetical protein GobsT_14350 [Gemmata obscuriglobus]|uniref:Uncharacterized protein n=1 Tax=Gemmata obscuriglobus TaxID=114 RepID=A0A2Z3HEI2_9BACT|nr:hypothetical protein [Gemmata obscuriglobus]AWM40134.1 hypothetical protein C1280_26105 [Gemmata obscuriglobus]QEG26690.1 hypothetical protein GobsT_14350 [Gemmata obscuriglobus]VTS02359.1 unnamed protein product [Gemmata obscuriglobus UQM 2246]